MSESRNDFVEDNLPLARSLVTRYIGRGIEYDDLYQAACLGLTKAAQRFDKSRGLCFSTYAVPVILGEIKQLFRSGGSLSVSRSLKELGLKAKKESENFELKHGRAPRLSELSELLSVDPERTMEALCASMPTISLDAPESSGMSVGESASFEDDISESLSLRAALFELSEEERRIIAERYIMNKTQQKTAQLLGVSQVQISRKEKVILCKLRSRLAS